MHHDIVIRGGLVVDGSGRSPTVADVAIDGDRISAVTVGSAHGTQEIDATGLVVTPGYVDVHTHLDAQLWWDPSGSPGSWHGVTSVVIGNCGVTFAPCRPGDNEYLATMMESVEDIPAAAILEGLPWSWTTYGEFLTALGARPLGVNVGGLVGHCALRYYAMGDESLGGTLPSPDQQAVMRSMIGEALDAGALGFSTSRTALHVVPDGRPVPGTLAPPAEVAALAAVLGDGGRGVVGAVTRLHEEDGSTVDQTMAEIDLLGQIALDTGRPVTFNLTQGKVPDLHLRILERVHQFRDRGAVLWPQTTVRPIGWLYGLCNRTPFDRNPSWRGLRGMPLDEKLVTLADAGARQRLIDEVDRNPPAVDLTKVYAFPPGAARYDLDSSDSLASHAAGRGVSPAAAFIDMALETQGRQLFTWPVFNSDEAAIETMLCDDATLLGLADAGAHVGQIMDASQPTYLLSYWVKQRGVLALEDAVRRITAVPAEVFGLSDRGRLAPGLLADVNIFDLDELALSHPEYVHDLPGGAGRFVQRADGLRWTFVNGVATLAEGTRTGALPGRRV